MKRAKRNWWGYAKSMVRRYPDNVNEDERKAVEAAIEKTKGLQNGEARLKVIDLMYFKATHQMEGAAQSVHYSYDRVKTWHSDFIWEVGKNFNCKGLF